jgi:trimeric autotransporter adhesin
MTDTNVNAWLDKEDADNALVLTSVTGESDKSPFEVTATAAGETPVVTPDTNKQVITGSADFFTLTAKDVANLNTTEKVTFVLSTDEGVTTLASTSKDVIFTKVGVADFASFEVTAPSTIHNEDASEFSFKVYGVKADGSKTLLKSDQYNLVLPSGFAVKDGATNNNTLVLTTALAADVIDNSAATTNVPLTKDFNFKVVINNDAASTVNKTVTVSAEDRKVTSFVFSTDGTSDGDALTALAYEASVNAGDDEDVLDLSDVATNVGVLDLDALEQNLYFVDQYGKEHADLLGDLDLTFSNLVDEDTDSEVAVINNNGTSGASVANLEAGDTVKVKVEIAGLASQTFTVTIK